MEDEQGVDVTLGRLCPKYQSSMLTLYVQQHDVYSAASADNVIYGVPEDSRLKPNGGKDCGREQYVLDRLYVQNIEVLR